MPRNPKDDFHLEARFDGSNRTLLDFVRSSLLVRVLVDIQSHEHTSDKDYDFKISTQHLHAPGDTSLQEYCQMHVTHAALEENRQINEWIAIAIPFMALPYIIEAGPICTKEMTPGVALRLLSI